eukprot:CAMPEP_0202919618 /NCGR_PEP_ID=MMETSP1392-20130828/76295_1 /ASSEMBLY_ACC=CAM_ASM_000868 /TAXON_ID=225041 /ORGANISM="Chlamydomonas chlamydogama, Strain SAG 11-48b" /LENGTH=159 /DNA_ID=CAMNT_0049613049 /DNA_START=196 /DNA_END=671 /DNA_ORIENTATION=+
MAELIHINRKNSGNKPPPPLKHQSSSKLSQNSSHSSLSSSPTRPARGNSKQAGKNAPPVQQSKATSGQSADFADLLYTRGISTAPRPANTQAPFSEPSTSSTSQGEEGRPGEEEEDDLDLMTRVDSMAIQEQDDPDEELTCYSSQTSQPQQPHATAHHG